MKNKLTTIGLLFLMLGILRGTTYYVSPTGLYTNPGTSAAPFTFQRAADVVLPGDIVLVRGGVYRPFPKNGTTPADSNTYTPIMRFTRSGGTESQPIKFMNYPNEVPVLRPYKGDGTPGNSGSWSLIKIYTDPNTQNIIPQYLHFEGLVFKGNADEINPGVEAVESQPGSYCYDANNDGLVNDGCALSCVDNDHDHVPDGCEWVRYNGQGFLVTGPFAWDPDISPLVNRQTFNAGGAVIADIPGKNNYAIPHHVTVKNCTFRDFPGAGMSFQRADYITVEGCTVANNCWYTIFGSSGINFYQFVPHNFQNPQYNNNEYRNKIINNVVFGNTLKVKNQNLVIRYDGNGVIVDDFYHAQDYDPNNITTFPNRGNIKYGIYRGRTLVSNNIIFGNGGSGLKVYSTQYVDVFHNTLFNNGLGNYRYFRDDSRKDKLRFGQLSGQASLFVQSIVDEASTADPRPIIAKGYNRIYNNVTYNTIGYPEYDAQYLDYSVALDPLDGNEAGNNVHGVNPQYVSITGTNIALEIPNKVQAPAGLFALQVSSPAVNFGRKLWDGLPVNQFSIAMDRLRFTRDALPDAGAYEVTAACVDHIKVGDNYTVVPAGINTSFSSKDRIVYQSLKSIEIKDVFDINPADGGVYVAEIISTCNNIANPSAARQMIADADIVFENHEDDVLEDVVYPNPVRTNGMLNFSKAANEFKVFNSNGIVLIKGASTDQVSVEGLPMGLYIIHIDGVGHTFVIE